jgi:drug/metabolite transporter (DMT)-like permease
MIIGELSALGGSCCWASCSTLFTAAVRRIGVYSLNLVRLWLALLFLFGAHWITTGTLVPTGPTKEDWFWLAISAVVGLVIGDLFYFGALKSIGPRVTMLLFILAPPVAALGEWFISGVGLGPVVIAGMVIALAGVATVIFERGADNGKNAFPITVAGVLLGAAAAVCQGAGLVLSKIGLDNVDALGGTLIRMLAAAPLFAVIFFATGRSIKPVFREGKALGFAFCGAFFGPFLGVTLSLLAVKHTHPGVAMTILSTTPITILPFSVFVYKERLTLRTLSGTVLAVLGVALLFLQDQVDDLLQLWR